MGFIANGLLAINNVLPGINKKELSFNFNKIKGWVLPVKYLVNYFETSSVCSEKSPYFV